MVTNPTTTTIRLSDANRERIEEHRQKNGSTVTRLVNIALDRFFADQEAQKKPA